MIGILEARYPDTSTPLIFNTPFQLMSAVMLSAQTTDAQVNKATPDLFARYPDASAMSKAPLAEVESLIRSIGFYRNKARNLIGAARMLCDEFDSQVPSTMDELVRLPGIGRKSAGVVLSAVYGKPAIIVDTHFGRVIRRLGFSEHTDPVKLEFDLASWLPESLWSPSSMLLNFHGRDCCKARRPLCDDCPVSKYCPSYPIEIRAAN